VKPFFSIKIEWNPADSEDQSFRDCFTIKRTVARQVEPAPDWSAKKNEMRAKLGDDLESVSQAISESLKDFIRKAGWRLPGISGDILLELADFEESEEAFVRFFEMSIEGFGVDLLDKLHGLIDAERGIGGTDP
jgi:hypothetical protein